MDKMRIMRRITPINMEKKAHLVKISILGFRDLQSTGILPVRSVKFKINTSSVKNLMN